MEGSPSYINIDEDPGAFGAQKVMNVPCVKLVPCPQRHTQRASNPLLSHPNVVQLPGGKRAFDGEGAFVVVQRQQVGRSVQTVCLAVDQGPPLSLTPERFRKQSVVLARIDLPVLPEDVEPLVVSGVKYDDLVVTDESDEDVEQPSCLSCSDVRRKREETMTLSDVCFSV